MASDDGEWRRTEFPFPFPPYPIQVSFMQELYDTLNKGGVGIFESPTGTVSAVSLEAGSPTRGSVRTLPCPEREHAQASA